MARAAQRRRTREVTLHRLRGVEPTPGAMLDALDIENLDAREFQIEVPSIGTQQALWVDGSFDHDIAEWCSDASLTTGLPISRDDRRGAGLLLLAVDGIVYAVAYGEGHRLIPDQLKDPRFGLRVAVRRLDAQQIQDLVRRVPGARRRTDATLV